MDTTLPTQDETIAERYAAGQQLLRAGDPAAAAAAFERCLTLAADQRHPLHAAQAADLLLAIANSYARAGRLHLAQANAQRALLLIQQRPGWPDELPTGITVFTPPDYDPSVALALAHELAAQTASELGQAAQAMRAWRDAAEAWLTAGQQDRAAQTLMRLADVARRQQGWDTLQEAAEQALELSNPAQQPLQIAAYQAIAQAHAARDRLPQMIEALTSAVTLERISRHPDLAADEQLLREVQQALSAQPPVAAQPAPPIAPQAQPEDRPSAAPEPARRGPERPIVTPTERERETAANVLKEFAYALCGSARVFEKKETGLLGGLRGGREPKEVWHWRVTNGSGLDPHEAGRELPYVTLELPHAPTTYIRVFLVGNQGFRIRLLDGRPVSLLAAENLTSDRALRHTLDSWFSQGLLVMRDKKLYAQQSAPRH